MKCPTCGRRPSERRWYPDGDKPTDCRDPIHDLADRAPELEAEVERLALLIEAAGAPFLRLDPGLQWEGAIDSAMEAACAEIERLRARVDEAIADELRDAHHRELAEARVRELERVAAGAVEGECEVWVAEAGAVRNLDSVVISPEAIIAHLSIVEHERVDLRARCAEMRAALERLQEFERTDHTEKDLAAIAAMAHENVDLRARCAEMRAALEEIAGVDPQFFDPQAASPEPEDIAERMRDCARAALEEKP